MTIRDEAIRSVLKWEGGETNDPHDPGKLTKWGISSRWNPSINMATLTKEQAYDFYVDKWNSGPYGDIAHPRTAAKLFLAAVLHGPGDAYRCLQRAVRSASALGVTLRIDGRIGPKSIGAVNDCRDEILVAALKSEVAATCRIKATVKPAKQRYLNGWLNRAYYG